MSARTKYNSEQKADDYAAARRTVFVINTVDRATFLIFITPQSIIINWL